MGRYGSIEQRLKGPHPLNEMGSGKNYYTRKAHCLYPLAGGLISDLDPVGSVVLQSAFVSKKDCLYYYNSQHLETPHTVSLAHKLPS